MNKFLGILSIVLLIVSCNNTNNQTTETTTENMPVTKEIGRSNYAVIWDLTTSDRDLIADNSATFTDEIISLYENDYIENVYFNTEAATTMDSQYPTISFFVKANGIEKAREILDDLSILKKGIATYKLFPVGGLWLDKNEKASTVNANDKTFVTIWDATEVMAKTDVLNDQTVSILNLWKSGKIENAYFDIEGIGSESEKTDFVFYVKAANVDEAKVICESLPIFKEKMATYKLHLVGSLWLGTKENSKL